MGWLAAPLGPLAGPECRRALRAGWLLWARVVLALPVLLWCYAACWIWWFADSLHGTYRPGGVLSLGLLGTASICLGTVIFFMPALTCWALAGHQSRAAAEVLLASPASALQIVAGRLAGRLCQLAVLVAAGLPVVFFFAGACDAAWWRCLVFLALLAAVAWGCGGLTLGLGASTRRARDAFLGATLLLASAILAHRVLGSLLPPATHAALVALDPFTALLAVWGGGMALAIRSIGLWILLGTLGIGWGAWRLRPLVLGTGPGRVRGSRRPRPTLGEGNPLLWKDLHMERLGGLHRLAATLGLLLSVLLALAGAALAGTAVYARWLAPSEELHAVLIVMADSCKPLLRTPVSLLLQWALGARAALSVAAERERGTWEGLLVSPLEGRQIVWAKIASSAYALRWLMAGAAIWWSACWTCGAMDTADYVGTLANTASGCVLMVSVGVWSAIAVAGVNRALALTAGVWLAGLAVFRVVSALLGVLAMAVYVVAVALTKGSFVTSSGQPAFSPAALALVYKVTATACEAALWVAASWLVALGCGRSFDRLVGRAPVRRLARGVPATRVRPGDASPQEVA